MKKLIFSIAALAAIVVMGSCSQDSDLTGTTTSKSKVDSVTVSLNLNSGIEVSESGSSMAQSTVNSANTPVTRAAGTRANSTNSKGNFIPDYSTSDEAGAFTAYFVAAEDGNGYTTGNIVAIRSGLKGSEDGATNSVSVPDIKYNIYVTNYSSAAKVGEPFSTYYENQSITTGESLNKSNEAQSQTIPLPKSIYTSTPASTTLYLFGETMGQKFSTATSNTVTVQMYSPYAAVAVSKSNSNVNNVFYGNFTADPTDPSSVQYGQGNTGWFYEYILATDGSTNYTTKSTIKYFLGTTSYKYIALDKSITAGYVYQYTVNNSGTLVIKTNPFNNITDDPVEIDPTTSSSN